MWSDSSSDDNTRTMYGYALALACAIAMMTGRSAATPALGTLSTVSYPASAQYEGPVEAHDRDSLFLQSVLLKDRLWKPILGHRVRLTAGPREPTDHFAAAAAGGGDAQVVDPFRETVLLMASNSMAGTHVRLAMAAVRGAMVCSALKHASLQAFLLHQLIDRDASRSEQKAVVEAVARWLEQMLRVTIDKLVAADQPAPLVARLHFHVRQLMLPAAVLAENQLRDIGQLMLDEIGRRCAPTEGRGPWASLIVAFKSPEVTERLDSLDEALSLDEHMKGTVDLYSIRQVQYLNGLLRVSEDVDAAGLADLSLAELKKLLTLNRIEMNFLWANLPIKALASSQWVNLFNVKPIEVDE